MCKAYKAVLYDLDGTIVNTLDMNMIPLMRVLEEETGRPWTWEQVLPYAPWPGLKVMESLHFPDPEAVYARWVQAVNEYENGATLFDGWMTVFERFQQAGIRQAVVSAKTRSQYALDVAAHGVDAFMETAVLADDTTKHKPDPEPIRLALEKLGLRPDEVLYIGDAPSDYEAANNAGVDFGWAKWGATMPLELPDFVEVFECPLDLLRLIP
ncbi:HAD family hydrolase [uncultured Dubosiella sp.]|uniref:HAD family hydrolase n=1 Tax=uncultured Dubosiella sp. TaxID=1937011 RepID=UPI00272F8B78|nr:HAD-IA family hydrolase [uncultured Dubosiella sp.]